MKKIFIFIGPPGSGKGTQAKKVAEKFGYKHVSTGDLIRSISTDPEAKPEEKKLLSEITLHGQLVPDWFVCGLVYRAVERFVHQNEYKGMVFDGAVRTVEQAERINQYLETKDLLNDTLVVAIMISDEESFNRLTKRRVCSKCREIIPYLKSTIDLKSCPKCGGELVVRPDDNEETIKARIEEQGNKALEPILDYYKKMKMVSVINGEQPIEAVEKDVDKAVRK